MACNFQLRVGFRIHHSTSVIRQKGESQNGCFKKTKHSTFSEKTNISYASGSKKCSFSGKFDLLCFLETPVLIFALLPYYRRVILINLFNLCLAKLVNLYYHVRRKNGSASGLISTLHSRFRINSLTFPQFTIP